MPSVSPDELTHAAEELLGLSDELRDVRTLAQSSPKLDFGHRPGGKAVTRAWETSLGELTCSIDYAHGAVSALSHNLSVTALGYSRAESQARHQATQLYQALEDR